jgi:hypothetical protein
MSLVQLPTSLVNYDGYGTVWSGQTSEPRLFQAECIGWDCVAWNKAVPVVHCVLMGGKIRTVTPKTEQNQNPKSLKAIIKSRIKMAAKENSGNLKSFCNVPTIILAWEHRGTVGTSKSVFK